MADTTNFNFNPTTRRWTQSWACGPIRQPGLPRGRPTLPLLAELRKAPLSKERLRRAAAISSEVFGQSQLVACVAGSSFQDERETWCRKPPRSPRFLPGRGCGQSLGLRIDAGPSLKTLLRCSLEEHSPGASVLLTTLLSSASVVLRSRGRCQGSLDCPGGGPRCRGAAGGAAESAAVQGASEVPRAVPRWCIAEIVDSKRFGIKRIKLAAELCQLQALDV
ncbi:unnamed protein product [Effrenium voratum]|uniref:Uncharacterized protein n=1 Tax=Effrenium voratum TaxID=2562239 RepID=A0AA36IXK7_9DINO|nr:unnamed protein product [Effrenium voratum]